jgi:hypothetical protein
MNNPMLISRKGITTLLLLLFVAAVAVSAGELTANTNDESAPLTDKLSTRTVWVKNKDGKGIENVEVIVDYDSERHPPSFRTDSQGKAEVKVRQGFWGLHINAGGGAGIRMTIFPQEVEWPCEVILPTRKTRF